MDEPSGSREVLLRRKLEARSAHNFTTFEFHETFVVGYNASHSTVTSPRYQIGVAQSQRSTPMMLRHLPYDPTPEDRLTHAKWARTVGIVYGSVVLLLLGFIAAQRIFAEPHRATGVANAPASPVAPQPAANRDALPTASIARADTRTPPPRPSRTPSTGQGNERFGASPR
jgi:hypothetical protein